MKWVIRLYIYVSFFFADNGIGHEATIRTEKETADNLEFVQNEKIKCKVREIKLK